MSVRLTNDLRDDIVSKMIAPFQLKVIEKGEELLVLFRNFLKSNTPTDIYEYFLKYPKLFDSQNSIAYYELISDEKLLAKLKGVKDGYLSIPYNKPEICFMDYSDGDTSKARMRDIFAKSDFYKPFVVLLNEWLEAKTEGNILKNKITCVLEHISTVNRLKNEFPEAYEAYSEIASQPISERQNSCDEVERVRAELNKKIKLLKK